MPSFIKKHSACINAQPNRQLIRLKEYKSAIMKLKSAVVLLLGALQIFTATSCKKENTNDCPTAHCHLNGNFIVNASYTSYYDGSSTNKSWNEIIELKVNGNQLEMFGHSFEITSDEQTIFTSETGNRTISITYSNEFSMIKINDHTESELESPSHDYYYEGERSELDATGTSETYHNTFEGTYAFEIYESNYINSTITWDTTYFDNLAVTLSENSITIGDVTISASQPFHDRAESSYSSSTTYTVIDYYLIALLDNALNVQQNIGHDIGSDDVEGSTIHFSGTR